MAAARGEIIGADDARPAGDPAFAANVVGRREVADVAAVVVGRETGETADLAKTALIEQQRDALAAVELATAALAHDAGFLRGDAQPGVRQALQRGHLGQQWRPAWVGGFAVGRCGRAGLLSADHDDHLSRCNRVASAEFGQRGHDTRARRADRGLHLHRGDHHQRVTGVDAGTWLDEDLDDRACMRAFGALVTFGHSQRCQTRRLGDRCSAAAQRCGLLGQEAQCAVGPRRRLGRRGPMAWGRHGLAERRHFGKQGGAGITASKRCVAEDRAQLIKVGLEAIDVELAQRKQRAVDSRLEAHRRTRLANQLGQQGVELRRRRQPEIAASVDPNTGARGFAVGAQRAGAQRDDAGLDRKTPGLADRLLVGQAQRSERRAGSNPELRFDQVQAGDLFGDGVLDLDPRIAFDEAVLTGLRVDQELHRAGVLVARSACQFQRIVEHPLAQRAIKVGRRGDFDQLLVAQLHRAIALVQVNDLALAVAEHLDLDVARTRHELLEEDRSVAKRRFGLALAAGKGLGHVFGLADHPHASTTATRCRFEHHRVTDRLRHRAGFVAIGQRPRGAGQHRDLKRLCERPRLNLVAKQGQRCRRWPDEAQALHRATLREIGVL